LRRTSATASTKSRRSSCAANVGLSRETVQGRVSISGANFARRGAPSPRSGPSSDRRRPRPARSAKRLGERQVRRRGFVLVSRPPSTPRAPSSAAWMRSSLARTRLTRPRLAADQQGVTGAFPAPAPRAHAPPQLVRAAHELAARQRLEDGDAVRGLGRYHATFGSRKRAFERGRVSAPWRSVARAASPSA
jgi:hypothetical protein